MATGTAAFIVKQLEPEGGWWNATTPEVIGEISDDMLAGGADPEDIREVLSRLISAIRAEYGE